MKWLSRLIYRYDLFVLLGAVILTVLSVIGVMRLSMVANVAYMLPRQNPIVSDYMTSLERMGTLDYLVILISAPKTNELTDFADDFAERIKKSGLVSEVEYTITEADKDYILTSYLPNLFLYLNKNDFDEVKRKLQPKAIDEAVRIDKNILLTPVSSGSADFVTRDPLNFLSIVQKKLFSGEGGFKINTSSGYYLSVDGTHLLMLARPVKPPQDVAFDEDLFSHLDRFESDIKAEKKNSDVMVEYTGGYPIAVHDASTIKRDLIMTMTSSIISVLLLFYLVFRRFSFLFYVAPSLGLGIFWTLGFAGFALGHLNIVTAAFGAILAGLGIDYSIHFYNRFLEGMFAGKGLERSLEDTFTKTGVSIFTGALTTAVAFFAMAPTKFTGLSELGIIGGVGIVMVLISSLTVLPALIVRSMKISGEVIPRFHIPSFGMGRLGTLIIRRRRLIVVVVVIITMVMIYEARKVHFETDVNKLRPKYSPALEVQEKIMDIFSGSAPELIITAEGKDLEKTLVVSENAADIMKKYPEVAMVEGPGENLPSVRRQRENIERARTLPLDNAVVFLKKSLSAHGFMVEPFTPFINSLSRFSHGTVKPVTLNDIAGTAGERMIKKYIIHQNGTWYVSIYAYPFAGGAWEKDIDRGVVKKLKNLSPTITVASITMVIAEMKKIIEHDFILATILASIGVLLTLLIQFRNPKAVIFCSLSLVAGIIWMIGFMGIFNMSMNFANIVVIPMIIGIGIDNNIHIYQRYKEDGQRDIVSAMSFTGRAVIMCALTTIVGFGSLTFSRYQGLASIGILSVAGVAICLLTAVVVLPMLLVLWGRERKD